MAFSRALAPTVGPEADALTAAMVGIGMGFATGSRGREPNIEDTLLFASIDGMEQDDLRVLAVLVTWFGVHCAWINADRITKLIVASKSQRVRALWSALAKWQSKDRRFARLAKVHRGPRVDLLAVGTDFQIRRHGEDPRFANGPLRVPGNVLRDRAKDVLSPTDLSRRHRTYRLRVMIGPSYRADLWATVEGEPRLSVAELARRTYASFASAWAVKRDFGIVEANPGSGGRMRRAGDGA
ncbi:MAG TPA: hypothetical protein VGL59_06770 [Polyangia bacterium]